MVVVAGERAGRDRNTRDPLELHASGDRRAKAYRSGRIDQTNPDPKCACDRIGLWVDLPHATHGGDGGVIRQGDGNVRIRRRGAYHLGRYVEYGVAPVLPGNLENHLSGLHYFARLGAARGDRSGYIRLELRVAHAIFREL